MTKCKTYQELISRMIDEDLTEAERSELGEHVKRCPDCAAVYVAFRSLSESLSADLAEPPASLHRDIMNEVRQSRVRTFSLRRMPAHKRWGSLLAAAACLILIVGVGLSLPRLRMGAAGKTAMDEAPQAAAEITQGKNAQEPMLSASDAHRNAPPPAAEPKENVEMYDQRSADREGSDTCFSLDAAQSEALCEILSRESCNLSDMPDESLTLEYLNSEGERQTLTVLISGEEACYVGDDGDRYYRIEGGAQALRTVIAPKG